MSARRHSSPDYLSSSTIAETGKPQANPFGGLKDIVSETKRAAEKPSRPVDSAEIVKKTVVGRNAETKRIVELSLADIEDMTGIPAEEMFGTDETGEKVAYIGAPWQALNVMDSERMFVFDYEYGEIADFSRNYDELDEKIEQVYYGEYSPGLEGYKYEVEQDYDEVVSSDEKQWVEETFPLVEEARKLTNQMRHIERSESTESIEEELLKLSQDLRDILQEKGEKDAELINQRESERLATGSEHAPYHPIEGFSKYLGYLVDKIDTGIRDIRDFNEIVAPKLAELEATLPDDLDYEERELRLKFEELSILNQLRLHKKTEASHVIVGIFPDLPIKDESMDRVVCSYSISTHVIPEATETDFRAWVSEIQRVLKPGGKAYIFPMQQGFPFGREYDERALDNVLDEFGLEKGGELDAEFYENPDEYAWRQDTTLIITKRENSSQ